MSQPQERLDIFLSLFTKDRFGFITNVTIDKQLRKQRNKENVELT